MSLLLLSAVTSVSWASTTSLPLDDSSELATWTTYTDGGGTIDWSDGGIWFDNGGTGIAEYIGYLGSTGTAWDDVRDERGWWVEAEISGIDAECPSTFFWVGTAEHLWILKLGMGQVVSVEDGSTVAPWPDGAHTLRLQAETDGTATLWIDDKQEGEALLPGEGTPGISFGQGAECRGASHVRSLTVSDLYYGLEGGDEDGDGVVNDDDGCIFEADADQVDTDADGQGDACDPCPRDPLDDRDGDGVCDSDDPTPDGNEDTGAYQDPEHLPVDTFMDQGPCGCASERAPVSVVAALAGLLALRRR